MNSNSFRHQKGIFSLRKDPLYSRQNMFYEEAYKTGITPWSPDGAPSPSLIWQIEKIEPDLTLKTSLDLGCGNGRHTEYLRSKGFKSFGIEYQETALKSAKDIGKKRILSPVQ